MDKTMDKTNVVAEIMYYISMCPVCADVRLNKITYRGVNEFDVRRGKHTVFIHNEINCTKNVKHIDAYPISSNHGFSTVSFINKLKEISNNSHINIKIVYNKHRLNIDEVDVFDDCIVYKDKTDTIKGDANKINKISISFK